MGEEQPADAPAGPPSDEDVIAEELFRDGLAALEEDDVYEASNLLSQCLQLTASKHGDSSVKAASVCIKYGTALLGCARARGTSVLGRLGKVRVWRSFLLSEPLSPVAYQPDRFASPQF
jgi:hypothetical protein